MLRVEPGRLDLERFEELVWQARQELAGNDPERARQLLQTRLSPSGAAQHLRPLSLEDYAPAHVARLEELRLVAIAARAEAMLALGRAHEVVPELEALTVEHPHDERLAGLLMSRSIARAVRRTRLLATRRPDRDCRRSSASSPPSPSRASSERSLRRTPRSRWSRRRAKPIRSVVALPWRLEQLQDIAELTEPFGRSRNPHEVILAWIEKPEPADDASSALVEATALLARLRAELVDRGARTRVAAFTSADRAEDVLRLARAPRGRSAPPRS